MQANSDPSGGDSLGQVGRQRFVYEQVDAAPMLDEIGGMGGVAAHDDRAPSIVDAVAKVRRVRPIEPGCDIVDHRRTMDGQRMLAAAGDPAQHAEFGQTVNVIRVRVGQEHRFDATGIDKESSQIARAIGSGIDDVEVRSGLDREAWAGALDVGQRAAGAVEQDVNALRQVRQGFTCLAVGDIPFQ